MKGFLATKKGKIILAVLIALIVVFIGIIIGVGGKKDSEESSGNKVNIEKEKDDEIGLQVVDPEDEGESGDSIDFSELTEDDEKDTDKDGTPDKKDDDDDNDGTPDEEDSDHPSNADKEDELDNNASEDTGSWGPLF